MANAEVSSEALSKIKSLLQVFQNSNAGFAGRVSSYAFENISSCNNIITNVAGQIDQLEADINKLNNKIQQLDGKIISKKNEKKNLQNSIPALERNLQLVEQQIIAYNEQLRKLQAQLSQTDDPDKKDIILNQIARVTSLLRESERIREELHFNIAESKRKISGLDREISEMKTTKMQFETEREERTRKLNHTRNKFEKLKSTLNSINLEFQMLTNASKSFESSASNTMTRSIGNIDKCIAYINEYMGVNL